ncbi:MAG: D-alanine--D-alanine ligase [Alphaproteobacteria bacterium]|nr:D-alanine--D-alanine ligase [Alphaproteobacteria bacterium]
MTSSKKTHVAVLMGGWSSEREISLISGAAVCKALEEIGHRVTAIDVQRDANGIVQSLTKMVGGKPDVVFNALHGRGGEDGTIQGLLEFVGIPYTHSGVMASALAMDKPLTKIIVHQAGVRCAEGCVISRKDILTDGYPFSPPFVIKPTNEGSSVGVKIILDGDNLGKIEEDSWIFGDEVLVEKYIPGHELTVAVLGDSRKVRALAVTELKPRGHDFYDYTAKYTGGVTDHLLPAPIPEDIYKEAMSMAEKAYNALKCCGAARVDIRWDDKMPGSTGLHFLEINTQPGLTPLSLLPEQAAHVGMTFPKLVTWILEHSICPA